MKNATAVELLASIAQESRLAIFRLLIQAGPAGLPAGDIATTLQTPPSTLSFHLKELTHAGMVTARQTGRHIYYTADFAKMNALVAFLMENCCGGQTQACCPPDTCQEDSAS